MSTRGVYLRLGDRTVAFELPQFCRITPVDPTLFAAGWAKCSWQRISRPKETRVCRFGAAAARAQYNGEVARRVHIWWTLLLGWLLNQSPAMHLESTEQRPTFARTNQDHDPHSESETAVQAEAQKPGTHISPVQPHPPRGLFVHPRWEEADAEHWAIQKVLMTAAQCNNAATIQRGHYVAGIGAQ